MKIKMLKSTPGALNGGLSVKNFKAGSVYAIADMEGLDKIFLEIGVAEVHETPVEVERHQNGLSGAPFNKRATPIENKKVYVLEDFEDWKAGDIRKLAEKNNVDLQGARRNTSAETLASMYVERQDN